MKPIRKNLFFTAAATLLATTFTYAADGTWLTDVAGNWSDTTKWTGGTIADGTDAIGNFNTLDLAAARTVTIDTTSRTIGTLNFDDTGASGDVAWTLASSGGATLTLATSSGKPIINTATSTTISSALLGTNGFTKNGGATLTLSGDNTSLSGGFTISAGTVTIGHNNALGSTASTIGIAAGTTLNLNAGISLANTGAVTMTASGNTSSGRAGLTLTNTSSLANDISLNYSGLTGAGNAFAYISSTGNSIANAAVYSGNISFSGGSANATAANNIFVLRANGGTGYGKVTGNIDLLTGNTSNTATLRIVDTSAVWELGGSANKWTTLDFNTNGAASQKVYVNSVGALASTGVITNTNSAVNGVVVNTGVLNLNNLADTAGFNQTVAGLQDGAGNVNGASRVNVTSTKAAILTIGGSGTYTTSGVISGAVALTMNGAGTQTLAGANTFTGTTTVSAGNLTVAGSSMIATGATGISIASGATMALTGTLRLVSNTSQIANSGTFDLASATDVLDLNGKFTGLTNGQTYDLFSTDGTINGTFNSITGYDTTNFLASFNNTTGVITFNAVPEPAAALLGGLGLLGLLRRRRA